jgi:type IV pilus assembly protein PilQ
MKVFEKPICYERAALLKYAPQSFSAAGRRVNSLKASIDCTEFSPVNKLDKALKYLYFFIKHTPKPLSRGELWWYFKASKVFQRLFTNKYRTVLSVLLCIVCCMAGTAVVQAQKLPPQLINPAKKVTFGHSISFNRAIDILSKFSEKYTDKPIIDHSNVSGKLGFSITSTSWRQALHLILEVKYLKLKRHQYYLEIVPNTGSTSALPDTGLTTHSRAVKINAIFFEGDRKALHEVGVDWSTLTNNVPANIGSYVNGQSGGSSGGSSGGQLPGKFQAPFVSVNAKGAKSVSENIFNALINFGQVFGSGISVQALFSAFQSDNLGKILSSPSIRVLNGESGHIQVGEQFYINQKDFAGNTVSRAQNAGTILNVIPHIITYRDTTFIDLDIDAQKSTANATASKPVIQKQESKTQVLLLNHEATVIAGLYDNQSTRVRKGIPILKNLPPWFFGLRYLFGYNKKVHSTRELIILIQTSIVPSIPERMAKRRLGEFDVLKNARNTMDNKIKRYHEKLKQEKSSTKRNSTSKDPGDTDTINHHLKKKSGVEHLHKSGSKDPYELQPEEIHAINLPVSQKPNPGKAHPSKNHQPDNQQFHYYVIGGAFPNKDNATALKQKMRRESYQPQILKNPENGYYMVAYKGFQQMEAAEQFRTKVASKDNAGAWIYEKQ